MRIKKAELEAIIKEELANVLKEVSAEEAGQKAADFARMPASGIPSIELASKALATIAKIKNLERAEKRRDEESCVEWTNKQARKRGWDVDGTKGGLFRDAGMTWHQKEAYEKILKKCKERRAQKKQMYKRQRDLAVQNAADAVRGSRTKRYLDKLKKLGLGYMKPGSLEEAVRRELRRMLSKDST